MERRSRLLRRVALRAREARGEKTMYPVAGRNMEVHASRLRLRGFVPTASLLLGGAADQFLPFGPRLFQKTSSPASD